MKKKNVAWVALVIACLPLLAKAVNQIIGWIAEYKAIRAGMEAEDKTPESVETKNPE